MSMDMSAAAGRSGHVRNAPHIVLLFVCLFIHAFWEMEGWELSVGEGVGAGLGANCAD